MVKMHSRTLFDIRQGDAGTPAVTGGSVDTEHVNVHQFLMSSILHSGQEGLRKPRKVRANEDIQRCLSRAQVTTEMASSSSTKRGTFDKENDKKQQQSAGLKAATQHVKAKASKHMNRSSKLPSSLGAKPARVPKVTSGLTTTRPTIRSKNQ